MKTRQASHALCGIVLKRALKGLKTIDKLQRQLSYTKTVVQRLISEGSVCSALCKALIKHMRLTHMWFNRIVYRTDHLLKRPRLISFYPCLGFCRSTTYFLFFFAIGQAALNVRGSSSNAPYRSIEPSLFSSPLTQ